MYSNELICNILDYINKNIDTEITIDLLSNLFFFNRTYIMKKFKKELNISIINYINTLKIYNSLSKYNQQSITTIALTSGFNSLEYYSEIFKKIIKVSPRKYLKFSNYYNYVNENDYITIQNSLVEISKIIEKTNTYLSKRAPKKVYKKVFTLFK
jgi:AraC-like DNA-binding protein